MKHKSCGRCGMRMVALDWTRTNEGRYVNLRHMIPGWFWWCNCGNQEEAYTYRLVTNYDLWKEVNFPEWFIF